MKRLLVILRQVSTSIRASDAGAALGLVLTTIGAGLIYLPLAFIIPGLVLFALSFVGYLRGQ